MLPTYTRLNNSNSGSAVRRSFRTREKCLIILVFLTLGFVCFGGFFYLPDNFGTDRVLKVYKQFQKAGPEIFIPAPPPARSEDSSHFADRAKLNAKIQEELNDFLEKPDVGKSSSTQEDAPLMNPPSPETNVKDSSSPSVLSLLNGEDANSDVRDKRNKVKEFQDKPFNEPSAINHQTSIKISQR
ncbi:Mannosyl-oligosaccharide alpha-1,2-mannosidase IA [Pseudolycoriella hygida]|uniref:Mannosyl-oligosaccharide alpha-1,2-mannosidase IA n=1 Tax=Pseudolycoriella hygida TaxID=35572 RepID=A0A9Q0S1K2_9DIPT|nr:Mannosyl-oligosaccharide alpha-1,2-mannosidase IA [Pseudolycoriella hygida]